MTLISQPELLILRRERPSSRIHLLTSRLLAPLARLQSVNSSILSAIFLAVLLHVNVRALSRALSASLSLN